jgi:ferritin
MFDPDMLKSLNGQINAELYSAYVYLSMASYLQSIDLPGSAAWMRNQALEERNHAMKIYDYIEERDGRVILAPIDGPPADFKSPLDAFERALAHERKVTGLIHALFDESIKVNDHATRVFLQWFVTEQVEEESSVQAIVSDLKRVGDDGAALLLIDKELGSRQPAE